MRDSEFDFIRSLVYERSRINLGPDKRQLVSARLGKRLRATNLPSVGDYCRLLQSAEAGEELAHLIDAISTNHAAGAVEQMLVDIDRKGFELIFVEGQAALMHYAYSSSIALLHASNPHAIVLVHDPRRQQHAAMPPRRIFRMCALEDEIALIERLSLPGGNRFAVVALATIGDDCVRELTSTQALPVADARAAGGPAVLLDAVLAHLAKRPDSERTAAA